MADLEHVNPDVKLCVDALSAKNLGVSLLWQYYRGQHPLAFTNPKLSDVIKKAVLFVKNWCQVIVNTSRDRLIIRDWAHDDATIEDALDTNWTDILRREARNIHLSALVTGEAFVVAWNNVAKVPRAYFHDPRQAHVIYDDDDPLMPRVACKTWTVTDGVRKGQYLNLYYPDTIQHYYNSTPGLSAMTSFQPLKEADGKQSIEPHDYGVIPVFHFRLDRLYVCGEITTSIISLQDAVNKLLCDMMVSSEYGAFAQRWAIGNFETEASKIPVDPGSFVTVPPSAQGDQAAAFGTFATTPPDNYLLPMDNLARAMSTLSGTPKHFFVEQSGDPSGEALQAMEAPLVAKIESYQEALSETWEQLGAFMMRLQGHSVEPDSIEVLWKDPHTVQPMTRAQIRLTNTQAGIPIANQLRDEGWTEDDIDELHTDANVASTMTNVPNIGALPARLPEPARIAAVVRAKDVLTERTAPTVATALNKVATSGAEGMMESGELGKLMDKFKDRKVRK